MIKAIVFDVGGVLKLWSNERLYEGMSEQLGVPKDAFIAAYTEVKDGWERGKLTTERALGLLGKEIGVSGEKVIEADQKVVGSFPAYYDTIEIARQLKANGYRIAILTNNNPLRYPIARKLCSLDMFDPIITSFETGLMKPQKEIYQLLLDRLGLKAEEVVFIDDIARNAEGATKAGIHGLVFTSAEQLKADLKALGVKIE